MKFNNPLVVFDLETTDDPADRRIIEIGAVYLDKDLGHQSTFREFVNPGVPVSQFVQDLTTITPGELSRADPFPAVAARFEAWVSGLCNIKQARLAAWGNYFDVNVLRQEFAKAGMDYPFSGTCIDVKTAALMWCAMAGKRTDKLGVETMMGHLGLPTEHVTFHRAQEDALATANIFRAVMIDLAGGVWVPCGGFMQYVHVKGEFGSRR